MSKPKARSVAERLRALASMTHAAVNKRDPVSGDEYQASAPAWKVEGWRAELLSIAEAVEEQARVLRDYANCSADDKHDIAFLRHRADALAPEAK